MENSLAIWPTHSTQTSPPSHSPCTRHGKIPIRKSSGNKSLQHLLDIACEPRDQPNPQSLYLPCEPATDAATEQDINAHLPQSSCSNGQGKIGPILVSQGSSNTTVIYTKDQQPLRRVKDGRNSPIIFRYRYLHAGPWPPS